MITNDNHFLSELERLRRDFEVQSGQYHDLTLSVYYEKSESPNEAPPGRAPNHRILLWQYMGKATPDIDASCFLSSQAKVSAFGIVEGPATKLFVRMACRAGSLFPEDVNYVITAAVGGNFVAPERPGKPVFMSNSNPLAVWLNLVLVFTATFQPERFRSHALAVDPFAASLGVFDYLRRKMTSQGTYGANDTAPLAGKKFKVALSCPGEKRQFVDSVAAGLQQRLGDVFYYPYYVAELAQPDLDVLLQRVYRDSSELIVVFLCQEYGCKDWTVLEWRVLRDLIKKRQGGSLMLMRFDDSDIPGFFSIDGYVDMRQQTPEEVVEIICERYRSQEQKLPPTASSQGSEADT